MKKNITTLFFGLLVGFVQAQWTPTKFEEKLDSPSKVQNYYTLDLDKIRSQLSKAQETGKNAAAVEVLLPTLEGKIERFAVYSFPVVVKELADQYELGSYAGVGIDDPQKYVRFSVAPNHFQSMMIRDGKSEFIESVNPNERIYHIHPPSDKEIEDFSCSINESLTSQKEIERLHREAPTFTTLPGDFSRSSVKKYRTLRLAVAASGEYTQYHGGTVADAFAAINATMTMVNGIFERDFAVHLNVQNFPNIIYTDPDTDPYSGFSIGEPQEVFTTHIGNANYDIGHLFDKRPGLGIAATGGVCIDPIDSNGFGKGRAFSQYNMPSGERFGLLVAHEMGHQLGAYHTYSHIIDGGAHVEPGSGSTIMGYPGSTNANVQGNPDPYFHTASINQVLANLSLTTCDVETPVISELPEYGNYKSYSIPKGTAFVLNEPIDNPSHLPLTYTWEQMDEALAPILETTGTNATGALFRSLPPVSTSTRYFPKLSSVLEGDLASINDWESVSYEKRSMLFQLRVRENNPIPSEQQTAVVALADIDVTSDGPFKVITQYANIAAASPIEWDVANTHGAPYHVSHVKIDYTADNGTTWAVLSSSTFNDGSENVMLPSYLEGQTIKVRVSSINNIFYAIGKVHVLASFSSCHQAPQGIVISHISNSSAEIDWVPVADASSYLVLYKKVFESTWKQTTSLISHVVLSQLEEDSMYEIQVSSLCVGETVLGPFSASVTFSTLPLIYCEVGAKLPLVYISNVSLANINNDSDIDVSANNLIYADYTTNSQLQINLTTGNTYNISIKSHWAIPNTYPMSTVAWIDFNRNGLFENSEKILNIPSGSQSTITRSFTVPDHTVLHKGLRMRVGLLSIRSVYFDNGISNPCGAHSEAGEYEDYTVVVSPSLVLAIHDIEKSRDHIVLYPNPATDLLKVSHVSDQSLYKIYNAVGQLVLEGTIKNKEINISSLLKGTYFITIKEKEKDLFRSKFIKN